MNDAHEMTTRAPRWRQAQRCFDIVLRCFAGAGEKVKDCGTTNGHIGPMVRTLMKDAREDLVRISGLNSQHFVQVCPTRVQPASHHRWQCKVIFYPVMSTTVVFV